MPVAVPRERPGRDYPYMRTSRGRLTPSRFGSDATLCDMATFCRWACACALVLGGLPRPVAAQVFEAVGSRAQGMGGAFVAVANDSSATWWNPAGLADGPFLDTATARA